MRKADPRDIAFWGGALALTALRLFLSSDLSVQITYSPHDDLLYVERAYHLLQGEGFGPYDSRVLIKYPGLSLWLAAMRVLNLPFLWSVNALYIGAGFYMALAMLRCAANRWAVLVALGLYLLNPVTFGYEWVRVLREPLGTGFFVLILAAMTHVMSAMEQGRLPWLHATVVASAFAFSVFLREDDRLLWGLLILFGAVLAWRVLQRPMRRKALVFLAAALIAPGALAKGYEYSLRAFMERHYGLPILHELSEGEYPRLLAAIRSIHSAKDNRMVMVTQEALAKLRAEIPAFGPVIDRLPAPGPRSLSCRIHGVCTEWSNGWMLFWIRDEAYRAGLTPTLIAAQNYFRRIRVAIEQACASGKLSCTARGDALLPPMELRWTRSYIAEGWRLAKMALAPDAHIVTKPPHLYNVTPEIARMYQAVTMTRNANTKWSLNPESKGEGDSVPGAWRLALGAPVKWLAALLLLGALAAFAFRAWTFDRGPWSALAAIGVVFGLYSLFRLAALSYVAVYMGAFDPRMMFSLYTAGIFLALPFIAEMKGAR